MAGRATRAVRLLLTCWCVGCFAMPLAYDESGRDCFDGLDHADDGVSDCNDPDCRVDVRVRKRCKRSQQKAHGSGKRADGTACFDTPLGTVLARDCEDPECRDNARTGAACEEIESLGNQITHGRTSAEHHLPNGCIRWFDGCNVCRRQNMHAPLTCGDKKCFRPGMAECRAFDRAYRGTKDAGRINVTDAWRRGGRDAHTKTAAPGRGFGAGVNKGAPKPIDFELLDSTSWWYDWSLNPSPGVGPFKQEFVAMAWGAKHKGVPLAERLKGWVPHPSTKTLLGFNEPNLAHQSNLTPEQACALWPDMLTAAKKHGLSVGSPAVNHCVVGGNGQLMQDGSPAGTNCFMSPIQRLDAFFALPGCGLDTVDFLTTHKYGTDAAATIDYLHRLHHRYKQKPIWLTEFAGAKNTKPVPPHRLRSVVLRSNNQGHASATY